ncbi:hypothetical protein V1514DRAFT_333746 [Lipomyces japonicus]|uniref:uncharacterized protein n=1 Tax=Lipomyces japonicus TaxID=56871 RepID=UPI0034CFFFB6
MAAQQAFKQRPAITASATVPGSITAPAHLQHHHHSHGITASASPSSASTSTRKSNSKSRKAITPAPKAKPAFVLKLWTMVNDSKNAAHIQWMPDGLSFQVVGREQFEKTVLPKYFKHSNFSSFVRQLNMYGWHKVQDVTAGAMHSGEETWQFKSPNFIKGREDLLDNIVRNRGSKGSDEEEEPDIHQVIEELEVIRHSQQSISEDLKRIKHDNELLWRESYQTRERHQNFSATLEKILRFLASVYGNPSKILGSTDGLTAVGSPAPQRPRFLLRDSAERSPIHELAPDPPSASSSAGPVANITSPVLTATPSLKSRGSINSTTASDLSPILAKASPVANSVFSNSPQLSTFDSPDFLDMIQFDGASTNANAPRPYFPPELLSQPSQPTPLTAAATSSLSSSSARTRQEPADITEASRRLINGLISSNNNNNNNNNLDASRLADNERSIDDLTRELDLQGQSLDSVQDWLTRNLVDYSDNHNPSNGRINNNNNNNNASQNSSYPSSNIATNATTPDDNRLPSSNFDVGEFLDFDDGIDHYSKRRRMS